MTGLQPHSGTANWAFLACVSSSVSPKVMRSTGSCLQDRKWLSSLSSASGMVQTAGVLLLVLGSWFWLQLPQNNRTAWVLCILSLDMCMCCQCACTCWSLLCWWCIGSWTGAHAFVCFGFDITFIDTFLKHCLSSQMKGRTKVLQ